MKQAIAAAVGILALAVAVGAGPSRFGFSDRVERHLFPEVTTGPAEPTWSPDGQWIAFSMQGDIWKVPAAGGEAMALTKGPWHHFEPEWSPDGRFIAATIDTGGNLDLGVVPAGGGAVERLTTARDVELGPTWSRDGQHLYFTATRGRGFDIFSLRLADKSITPVVTTGGDQIQPAVSPDGKTLAYVSPVSGRLGTGGIWTQSLEAGAGTAATLVHYEESEYRMRPKWTPDGRAFLYGSDELGSNDIAIVSAGGGNSVVLTNEATMGEFSAVPSPDGTMFGFISNRSGPMTLYVAPIGGGPVSSWRKVVISTKRHAVPSGRVRGRLLDAGGRVVAGRV